jgi:hypothetical protein
VTTATGQATSSGIFYVPLAGYTNPILSTIAANGNTVTENVTNGQPVMLTFSGAAGQQVSLVTYSSFVDECEPNVGIQDPYGNVIESNFTCSDFPVFLFPITLRATGTYTVFVGQWATTIAAQSPLICTPSLTTSVA